MALATNSTDGDVILAGDLGGTATSPTLTPTGVNASSYEDVSLVVDAKGRVLWAKETPEYLADLTIVPPIATDTVLGTTMGGTDLPIAAGVMSNTTPDASTLSKGIVQISSGLSVASGVVTTNQTTITSNIPDATTSSKGKVQAGTNINVASGVISVPDATTSSKGVVQAGTNINVASGVISVPDATTSSKGVVQAGTNINVASGVISVAKATNTTLGLAKSADTNNITIDANGGIDVGHPATALVSDTNSWAAATTFSTGVSTYTPSTIAPDLSIDTEAECAVVVKYSTSSGVPVFRVSGWPANCVIVSSNCGSNCIWPQMVVAGVPNGEGQMLLTLHSNYNQPFFT